MVWRQSRSLRSDRETLPEDRKWSGDPPGGPEVVGGPSKTSELVEGRSWKPGSGWETLSEVRTWSGDPPGGLEEVGRPFQKSGSGRDTLPEVRK